MECSEFLSRRLDHTWFPYVFVDATYLDVRVGYRVVCQALVVAMGRLHRVQGCCRPGPAQGVGKVDGRLSDVRGFRRVDGGAARPRRDDRWCLIILVVGGRAAMSSSATTAPSRQPLREVLQGVADPRDRRGVRPRPGLGRVPGRGGRPGGVPHSGGDARARRRPGSRSARGLWAWRSGGPCRRQSTIRRVPRRVDPGDLDARVSAWMRTRVGVLAAGG